MYFKYRIGTPHHGNRVNQDKKDNYRNIRENELKTFKNMNRKNSRRKCGPINQLNLKHGLTFPILIS